MSETDDLPASLRALIVRESDRERIAREAYHLGAEGERKATKRAATLGLAIHSCGNKKGMCRPCERIAARLESMIARAPQDRQEP